MQVAVPPPPVFTPLQGMAEIARLIKTVSVADPIPVPHLYANY